MSVIQLRVPAEAKFSGLVRNQIVGVAAQTQLGIEAIDDLKLGVDEAFGIVIAHNPTSGDVLIECRISPDELSVTVTGPTGGHLPESDDYRWLILNTVATGSTATIAPEGNVTVMLHSRVVASA